MKEVSCRFFDALLRDLRDRGIDPQRLVDGTVYTPKHLANKDERVEWSALLRMMENSRKLWTRDELLGIGKKSTEGPLVQFIGVVARIRFSVAGFFQWVTAPTGVASQMITCVKTSSRADGPGRLIVDFRMEPGYEASEEFFVITEGTYAAMPRMLGAAPAKIRSISVPNGARFHVSYTESRGVIPSVRRFIAAPFTMKQAADELADAHSSLLARYEELDSARTKIELKNELLDIAYRLGQRIAAERDLEKVGAAVTDGLVATRSVVAVRLTINASQDVVAVRGTVTATPTLVVNLRGIPSAGRIEVWTDGDDAEARQLLELVAPTIALAIDNAVAYRELAEYQAGLEKLVDQRTTELRLAGDELTDLVEQLRAAQDARERFFGNISHEIRTPLALILLATSDVEKRAGHLLDERARGGLGAVTDGARKLLRLVDELLLLAAGQADKLTISPEPTDVSALIGQLTSAWRLAAEAAGLELDARVPESLFALIDPVAIERVVSNLLSNAIKYTPRGGRIEIDLAVTPEHVRLAVLDCGPGIDADLASRLFGRFERAAGDDRRKAGTGIGLALVKQLVEAHGGTVSAHARATGGTEMRVLLPASIVLASGSSVPTSLRVTHLPSSSVSIESGMVLTPPGLSGGTILIAEDEPRLALSIAQLLSERYTVIVALDGAAALELVKQHQPQLLITDVDMPGMTGIELSRKFREITNDRLAPIIILSAVMDLRTRVAGLEAGAVDYVGKPFDPAELTARVQSQFRMRDLAMRLHRAEQLAALGILTSGLAHELRNPANGIVNAIAPLLEMLPPELVGPDTGSGELLDVIKGCAEQIAFLTRQLLGFRENTELELRPAVMADLVQRAVRLAKGGLTGIDVRTNLAIDQAVMCAPPLLVQVLTNLVENAGHAAGRGGWVEVRGSVSGGRVSVEVADSGPGVPRELRERVFEPFFTTKSPGSGNGLGLSVARTIAHRHGGTLEIRERGSRTAFVLELAADSNLARLAKGV